MALTIAWLPGAGLSDVIVLENGDRLTGTVVKKTGKNVRFETADSVDVHFPWSKVRELRTDRPVTALLENAQSFTGSAVLPVDAAEVPNVR